MEPQKLLKAFVSERPYFSLSDCGKRASFYYTKHNRLPNNGESTVIELVDEEKGFMMRGETIVRYPLLQKRTKKFADQLLQTLLPFGVMVYLCEPRTVGLEWDMRPLMADLFDDELRVQIMYNQLSYMICGLMCTASAMRLSHRLMNQEGLDRAEKLTPARLAEYTAHGIFEPSYIQ
ncbi:MAG: hypothetical protein R3B69_01250 [Candidatus Paceibacterota bacterium]